jgi:hypothetical protein
MAIQNITNIAKDIVNAPTSIKDIPPELISNLATLITILKAAGIIFLIYVFYLIFNGIINWKNNRRIKGMYEKIDKIEEKVNEIEKAVIKKK